MTRRWCPAAGCCLAILLCAARVSGETVLEATAACAGRRLLPTRGNASTSVGLVRIQKTGSTTLSHIWDLQKRRLGKDAWEDWTHSNHYDWGDVTRSKRQNHPSKDLVVVDLRDPVERVLSEYYFCTSRLNCVQQEQWDYKKRAENANVSALFRRMVDHVYGHGAGLGLREWVAWPDNPAHERMANYVSGFRYGRKKNNSHFGLDVAVDHLCGPRAIVLLSADAPNASLALVRAQLGWQVSEKEWAQHRPPGSPHFDGAPNHLPPRPDRVDVDAATRADIKARNPRDSALYEVAQAIVADRAAMLARAPPAS